jgi:hypothetical protein
LLVVASLAAAGCTNRGRSGGGRGGGGGGTDGGAPPDDDGGAPPGDDGGTPPGDDAGTPPRDGGGGVDAGRCAESTVECGGLCADLTSSSAHCGTCFRACAADEFCEGGECLGGCTPDCSGRECGTDGCGGTCGSCGAGTTCDGVSCVTTCELTLCGEACVDTTSDPSHCGDCFSPCGSGETCSGGTCTGGGTPGGGESCSSATTVAAGGGTYTFSLSGRTGNHAPSCGAAAAYPDVAFVWRPSRSGTAMFSGTGPSDTTIAVYSSSSCTSTVSLGCDDDGGTGTDPLLSLSVTSGSTYYVVMSSYSSSPAAGTFSLTVTSP